MLSSLVGSFRIQARVIWALILRELHTRYGRENLGYLWIVGEPTMFCVGVAIMWTAIRPAHEHGIPMTAFVITGYIPLTMWRHSVSRSVKAFDVNGALLFHRQVTPLDIILARVILEIYGSIVAGLIVGGAACVMGYMEFPYDWGLVYLGLFYLAFFCLGCALLFSALSERSDLIEKIIGPITYLSIPFSGAFSMVDWVSPRFQDILLYSPCVNAVELIRSGVFGPSLKVHYDVTYTSWSCAALLIVALALTLGTRRYIIVQ
jgi:capsular polysaccharide transport system permease protein